MGYRLPFMTELVFLLVGAYLVALPRIAQRRVTAAGRTRAPAAEGRDSQTGTQPPVEMARSAEKDDVPVVMLEMRKTAEGFVYRLGEEAPVCPDRKALRACLKTLAARDPRPRIRVETDASMAWGSVIEIYRLCRDMGFELDRPQEDRGP